MERTLFFAAALGMVGGCDDGGGGGGTTDVTYKGYRADTILEGTVDNVESVKAIPGTDRVLALSSKSRELLLLRVSGDALTEVRTAAFFADDSDESELTNFDVAPSGALAVLTHTLVETEADGTVTSCAGEAVFVDVTDSGEFGTILIQIDVGPMPDGAAWSPDGQRVAIANERDVVWGKCDGVAGVEPPSVSIIDVNDPILPAEVARVTMTGNAEREPESIVFSADGSVIVATLQDTHELAFINVATVLAIVGTPTDGNILIVDVPQNDTGTDPWPDGVTRVTTSAGEIFATANEANDTVTLFDADGSVVSNIPVLAADIPATFPRADGSWGPVFRPDSITAFDWQARNYIAVTLKASGAVEIWDVTDPTNATVASVVKVGEAEGTPTDEGSTVAPEGITANSTYGWIVTANEGESSASLILPLD